MLRAENQLKSTVEIATDAGFCRDPAQHFFLERYEVAYLAEMRALITAASGGQRLAPELSTGCGHKL